MADKPPTGPGEIAIYNPATGYRVVPRVQPTPPTRQISREAIREFHKPVDRQEQQRLEALKKAYAKDKHKFEGTLADYAVATGTRVSPKTLERAGILVRTEGKTAGQVLRELRKKVKPLRPEERVVIATPKPRPKQSDFQTINKRLEQLEFQKRYATGEGKRRILREQQALNEMIQSRRDDIDLKRIGKPLRPQQPRTMAQRISLLYGRAVSEGNIQRIKDEQRRREQKFFILDKENNRLIVQPGAIKTYIKETPKRYAQIYKESGGTIPFIKSVSVNILKIPKTVGKDVLLLGGLGSPQAQVVLFEQARRNQTEYLRQTYSPELGQAMVRTAGLGTFGILPRAIQSPLFKGIIGLQIGRTILSPTPSNIGQSLFLGAMPLISKGRTFEPKKPKTLPVKPESRGLGSILERMIKRPFKIKTKGYQQLSKVDRYGNVYESMEPVSIKGQVDLFGNVPTKPSLREPITGWKGFLNFKETWGLVTAKTRYSPKDYVILQRGGEQIRIKRLDVEGVLPVFSGTKIVRYRNIGDIQTTFPSGRDKVTAMNLLTGRRVEIDPLRIRDEAKTTFFKVGGRWLKKSELDTFRTEGKRVEDFRKKVELLNPRRETDILGKVVDRPDPVLSKGNMLTSGDGQKSIIFRKMLPSDLKLITIQPKTVKVVTQTSKTKPSGQKSIIETTPKPTGPTTGMGGRATTSIRLIDIPVETGEVPTIDISIRSGIKPRLGVLPSQRPITIPSQRLSLLQKQITQPSLRVRPTVSIREDFNIKSSQKPVSTVKIAPLLGVKSDQIPLVRTRSMLKQQQLMRTSTVQQLQKTRLKYTSPKTRVKSDFFRQVLPRGKLSFDQFMKQKGFTSQQIKQAYDVYVKRRQAKLSKGKYISTGYLKANKRPYTKSSGKGRLFSLLDKYSNRSGYLKPARGKPVSNPNYDSLSRSLLYKFRRGYRKNHFVERTAFAIDSMNEKLDIPYKSARMRRQGQIMTKRKKPKNMLKFW